MPDSRLTKLLYLTKWLVENPNFLEHSVMGTRLLNHSNIYAVLRVQEK